MAFFRQYMAPLIVVIMFLFALFVVSARIFLPGDMSAPAPIGTVFAPTKSATYFLNHIRV
ncbi:conserved exported hypothetical protein [Planktothrix sp. PCC 11201]|uniref:hypothetical protein n=1 Tax=Planktothrix sp. PCC 11201 TaxID=1729650 RepID=UPI000910D96C|nr:hypothetical protein [Planktothrix sp. PCC 11201]SKB12160.1 conserved exported hypothetical protein [Planktothrix sp. PCC 11201]